MKVRVFCICVWVSARQVRKFRNTFDEDIFQFFPTSIRDWLPRILSGNLRVLRAAELSQTLSQDVQHLVLDIFCSGQSLF